MANIAVIEGIWAHVAWYVQSIISLTSKLSLWTCFISHMLISPQKDGPCVDTTWYLSASYSSGTSYWHSLSEIRDVVGNCIPLFLSDVITYLGFQANLAKQSLILF